MSLSEVVIEGTLKPDGTLELDQKPKLAPGRVRVVVQPVEGTTQPATEESLWQFMERTRRELEAAGSHFMSGEEVQDHIDWLREPDRSDEMLRQGDQERQSKEHS
jgi:hypothetical protein